METLRLFRRPFHSRRADWRRRAGDAAGGRRASAACSSGRRMTRWSRCRDLQRRPGWRTAPRRCLADRRLVIPCGGDKQTLDPDVDVYGPIAFTANRVYFASPDDNGMVALWSADLLTKRAHRVSNFSRDAYAPSVAADGTVVFKVQSYRTHLADVARRRRPDAAADDVPVRNAVVSSDAVR